MFERLQKKWKVTGLQLFFIISTFAIGGSLTGYAARQLMPILSIDQKWLWILIYILLVTLLWPLAVLIVSIPFGQFTFFNKYIHKIGRKIGIGREKSAVGSQQSAAGSQQRVRIAIFASGAGSNAQVIIDRFRNSGVATVSLIVTNNPTAGVLQIAQQENIPALVLDKTAFAGGEMVVQQLKEHQIGLVVLAGFLLKLPPAFILAFPKKIINIHPALLPNYGGKGMYGRFVHQAVLDNKEKESGISIHYADELYDHGQLIFQARCPVLDNDTITTLEQRIRQLEHEHYGAVIEKLLVKQDI
jgi:formyltetrahydrofolate-dependent phosphoribosylglycinamide formyltransferase